MMNQHSLIFNLLAPAAGPAEGVAHGMTADREGEPVLDGMTVDGEQDTDESISPELEIWWC